MFVIVLAYAASSPRSCLLGWTAITMVRACAKSKCACLRRGLKRRRQYSLAGVQISRADDIAIPLALVYMPGRSLESRWQEGPGLSNLCRVILLELRVSIRGKFVFQLKPGNIRPDPLHKR